MSAALSWRTLNTTSSCRHSPRRHRWRRVTSLLFRIRHRLTTVSAGPAWVSPSARRSSSTCRMSTMPTGTGTLQAFHDARWSISLRRRSPASTTRTCTTLPVSLNTSSQRRRRYHFMLGGRVVDGLFSVQVKPHCFDWYYTFGKYERYCDDITWNSFAWHSKLPTSLLYGYTETIGWNLVFFFVGLI